MNYLIFQKEMLITLHFYFKRIKKKCSNLRDKNIKAANNGSKFYELCKNVELK